MGHVVVIDSTQRCAGCGERIEPGAMHETARSDVDRIEYFYWHAEECPVCAMRAAAGSTTTTEGEPS